MEELLLYRDIYRGFAIEKTIRTFTITNNVAVNIFSEKIRENDYLLVENKNNELEIVKIIEFTDNTITLENELMYDEYYDCYVCLIRPSKMFIALNDEINTYKSDNKKDGLQSESIPNYSYTKSQDGLNGWQGVFSKELKQYYANDFKTFGEWVFSWL